MNPLELQHLLREFYLERLSLLMMHESGARFVSDYDVNNAYQYIINREETHVSWLQHALLDVGLAIPNDPSRPDVKPSRKGNEAVLEIAGNDARANQAFAWNPSIVGIKSEDTVLCTAEGVEVLTAHSAEWPTVVGKFDGKELARADVLVR